MAIQMKAVFLFLLLVQSGRVSACGTCTIAWMWNWYPPAPWWLTIGVWWFLSLSAISFFSRIQLPRIPRFPLSIAAVLGALLISMLPLGPLLLIVFPLVAAASTVEVLRRYGQSRRAMKPVKMAAAVAGGMFVVSAVYGLVAASRMDLADKVIAWGETTTSRRWERQLELEEPASLNQYRKILQAVPLAPSARVVAKRLAEVGDPQADIPLLLGAADAVVQGAQQSPGYKYMLPDYRDAISRLSGIRLEDGDDPAEWRRQLQP